MSAQANNNNRSEQRQQRISRTSGSNDDEQQSAGRGGRFRNNRGNFNKSQSEDKFRSTNQIMQGHELMKDFSKGTYDQWCNKLVEAAQDKCTTFINDALVCIRKQQEATIAFDNSLEPKITLILDAAGNTIKWSEPHPLEMKRWEIAEQKHQRRKEAYTSNKLIICSIIKASIEPYYEEKLEKHSEYENKRDNLHCLDLLKYKKLFQQKFSSLKDNKMALGVVEALTTKYSSGSADKKKKQAIKQYAAMIAICNAGPQYDTLRTELQNNFAKSMPNVYPTTVEDAFELLQKYKPVNHNPNNSRNNNNCTTDTRNSSNTADSSSNDRHICANNEGNRGSNNDCNSINDNHQLLFAQAAANNGTDNNEPQLPPSSRTAQP